MLIKVGLQVNILLKKGKKSGRFSTLKNELENQNFEIFEEAFHNFGKSEDGLVKM